MTVRPNNSIADSNSTTSPVISNRYDFVILFDVTNGNPNGDPDAGNSPRLDPETQYGYVTDVCIKRKIRNYVDLVMSGKPGYNIAIKPDRSLNSRYTEAYEKEGLPKGKQDKASADVIARAREHMCRNYYDVRTFGQVMNTGDDRCGIVRGPVQINFANSVSRIFPQEITITRQAVTKTTDMAKRNRNGAKDVCAICTISH